MTRRPDDQFPLLMNLQDTIEYVGRGKDFVLADIRKAINPLPAKKCGREWIINRRTVEEYYRD